MSLYKLDNKLLDTVALPRRRRRKNDGLTIKPLTNVIFNILVGAFAISAIIPFLMVVSISFTEESAISKYGYRLFHTDFSLKAYEYVFSASDQIYRSFFVSVVVTVLGTILCLFMTSSYAYPLYRRTFPFKKFLSLYNFFTMMFSGGLVPTYLVMTQLLHLKNTIWALIIGGALNSFWVFIMRTFYSTTIPESLIDSAMIDGCTEFKIYYKIVLPISLPALATLGLFTAVGYWNSWFEALLYIEKAELVPLQYMLMQIERNIQYLIDNAHTLDTQQLEYMRANLPAQSVRNAITVIVVLPIALSYPFFQKYFIRGITIGAVKG
ncbi:MAG TPA: carbohydrate ABC transporter permease [Clostridiales bacterium]|nr:carbohydrate ABC transporter permease [Clostridiales bacterium]